MQVMTDIFDHNIKKVLIVFLLSSNLFICLYWSTVIISTANLSLELNLKRRQKIAAGLENWIFLLFKILINKHCNSLLF